MIKIENFSFKYKGTETLGLDEVNLTIPTGQCVLLCGRSGCGKTTLLRVMNGLIPHFYEGSMEGTAIVEGMDTGKAQMYQLAEKIGMVYQNPRSQFFNIDTDSEIAFGIENMGYPKKELMQRFQKTIEHTGVGSLLGRTIFQLSGGEKQRVAFASIYAMEPSVFLLDEPSANLDEVATDELRKRIQALKKAGKTIVITEHRLHYLTGLIDRAIYLSEGKLLHDWTAEEFFGLGSEELGKLGLRAVNLSQVETGNAALQEHPVLEVTGLCGGYKKERILHEITFSAAQGDIIAITGHNGAGKSTLSEVLCGLLPLQSGHIIYHGKPQTQKQWLRHCGMVFQDVDYQLFSDSVAHECSYGGQKVAADTVSETLSELGLEGFSEHHPTTLSGGQKQRLAVAVNILSGKDILLFDEPTSGLDYDSMCRVAELIRSLSQKNKIIFIVTHDYELICSCCTRVLRLEDGHLRENYVLDANHTEMLKSHYIRSAEL